MQDLLPEYRRVTAAYFDAVTMLGMRLLRLLAMALELDADFFHPMFSRPMLFLRPLHYIPRQSLPEKVRMQLCLMHFMWDRCRALLSCASFAFLRLSAMAEASSSYPRA